jgi:hypothetical protein
MGFPAKVQLIQRKESEQWYINFPSALAQAMEFEKGEQVEWIVADRAHLILSRQHVPPDPVSVKKRLAPGFGRSTLDHRRHHPDRRRVKVVTCKTKNETDERKQRKKIARQGRDRYRQFVSHWAAIAANPAHSCVACTAVSAIV